MPRIIYSDKLIELTDKNLLFRHYYFPLGDKTIELKNIKRIEILKPTLMSGKWRIHGTGDFTTWFPWDAGRPNRDMIFRLTLHKGWLRIGFTVENSARVKAILEEMGLLAPSL